jgi:hypothetical protein
MSAQGSGRVPLIYANDPADSLEAAECRAASPRTTQTTLPRPLAEIVEQIDEDETVPQVPRPSAIP